MFTRIPVGNIGRGAFWLSLPFLLPQALWVRKTAPRFAAAGGPTSGVVGEGKAFRLLGIGDSIIAGVGAQRMRNALIGATSRELARALGARVNWAAHGIIGANCATVVDKILPSLPRVPADFVVISVGVNDVTSLTRLKRWQYDLARLLSGISLHSPDASIAVAGLPPLAGFPVLPRPLRYVLGDRARHLDAAAREVVETFANALHVPVDFETRREKFADDGFHPSEHGYQEFGERVAAELAGTALSQSASSGCSQSRNSRSP